MGRGFFHIVLMPEDGGQVRNFRITGRALRAALLGSVVLLLALATSLAFHLRTFRETAILHDLRAENEALRDQLERFSQRADAIQSGVQSALRREREARLLAGLDPVDDQTRQLGIGGPLMAVEPSAAIRGMDLREELLRESRRLDAMERQVDFQRRSYDEVLGTLEERREKLSRTPTISPVRSGYTFSSGFGPREDPFTGRWGQHNGLDLRASPGTPVLATADGTVRSVGFNGDYGLTIQIEHGDGLETVYSHLASASVRSGQAVRRWDRVGSVGSSGRSTGPHLHYEVWLSGQPVDPGRFILGPATIVD